MPETEWEKTIDKMIDENTKVYFIVFSNEDRISVAGDTLVKDHDYFFRLYILNDGTEVNFSHLQARCTLKGISNVVYYSDGTYSTPASRVHLEWTDVEAKTWVWGDVYFRVTKDLKDANITHYGIYGVVVPRGHMWGTLNWNADAGPQ